MAYNADGRIVRNFSIDEMSNSMTSDQVKLVITPEVIEFAQMMQHLRNYWGKPMKVNSWYRTKEFNTRIGGDVNSAHLDGIAADIALPSITDRNRNNLIEVWRSICINYGVIGGVSIYSWGVHFDANKNPMRYGKLSNTFRITDFRR